MTPVTRRRFLTLSAAASAGAALSACTGSSSGGGSQNSRELRLFTYEDNSTIGLLKAQVKKFDEQNGTTTTVDTLPGSGAAVYPDKLRTELLGGKGPDVWRIWGGQIGAPFAKAKQALDLAPYYEKFGWDAEDQRSRRRRHDLRRRARAACRSSPSASAPGTARPPSQKAGITAPPTSYAELEEANAKLRRRRASPRPGTAGKYGWHVMRLFEYLLETAAGPELHDKLLTGAETWDRPEVVTAFTNFKKWQDQKWMPAGRARPGPGRRRAAVRPGQDGVHHHRAVDRGAGASRPAARSRRLRRLPAAHRSPAPARHSGFVEGYMVNAKSGNPDKAAALLDFLVQPDTQKALKITASTVAGAEPDKATLPLSYEWAQGPGQAAVLHDPGPGVPEAAGRPVLRHPERRAAGQDQPGRRGQEDAGRRQGLGQEERTRWPPDDVDDRRPARGRRPRRQRRLGALAVRAAGPARLRRVPGLPGAVVAVVQPHRLGRPEPDLQRRRPGQLPATCPTTRSSGRPRSTTSIWTVVTIVVPVVLGLALAVAAQRQGPRQAGPAAASSTPRRCCRWSSIASIWGWLYNPQYGAINAFLRDIGLDGLAQPWLGQDSTALAAIMVPAIWLRVGFPMLLYLAALQGIPQRAVRGGHRGRRQPLAAVLAHHHARACGPRTTSSSRCR